MSATTNPISPEAFALAIADLPLSSLHAKAAELSNSIAHLRSSNSQLQPFAADGDADCSDAIRENEDVIRRMEERIRLLRQEVEGRGMRWAEGEVEDQAGREAEENGLAQAAAVNGVGSGRVDGEGRMRDEPGSGAGGGQRSGRLTDEQLERMLRERMGEARDEEEEEGVHL